MAKQIFIYYLGPDYLPDIDYQTPTGFDNFEDKYINTLETRNKAILEHQKSERYTLLDFIQAFNSEEISDLGWIAFNMEDDQDCTVVVNIVELSSELANDAAGNEMIERGLINDRDEMVIPDPEDSETLIYTEKAQDIYNHHYDYFYNMIDNIKLTNYV